MPKTQNLPHLYEEFSYMVYTFFQTLPEMKGKPPWRLFETYHMYAFKNLRICNHAIISVVLLNSSAKCQLLQKHFLHFFIFIKLHIHWLKDTKWAMSWENLFMPYANNKGADQPAHPHSLISSFVVRCLEFRIPIPVISKISRFKLASVAEHAGLSPTRSQTPEDRFYCVAQMLYAMTRSISLLSKISRFKLASLAEHASLSPTRSQTPEDRFYCVAQMLYAMTRSISLLAKLCLISERTW